MEPMERHTPELPKAAVELLSEDGFKIQLQKLRTDEVYDQGPEMVRKGQGCITTPTGPGC